MKFTHRVVTVAAVLSLAPWAAVPATAVDGDVTHSYEMNEAQGASTMSDSGTAPVNGLIGNEVQTGISASGATGYRFPWLKPNTPPAHPGHLVSIPDDPSVDPLDGYYSLTIRYRTRSRFGNLIQKGQAKAAGGQFKIQLPKGQPACYYKGSQGRAGVRGPTSLADGRWHVLTCTRSANAVELTVDGQRVGRKNRASGNIDNGAPITVGGKPRCDQIKITCDYFAGMVDYVRITGGN